jgi:DNA recombination protein RmuC
MSLNELSIIVMIVGGTIMALLAIIAFISFSSHKVQINDSISSLTSKVEQQLLDGLLRSHTTFTDIVARLTTIDDAQKNLSNLSSDVLSLQEILIDKRARGAFGEVQLANIIHNLIPASKYALQYQLSNGTRCDCILFLPEPTKNLVIDSKFPLENYQRFTNFNASTEEKARARKSFVQDIKKHIGDIASKYIIPTETSDGAIMFIPAESIFAEIHDHYPELVEFAHSKHVWLASPTTMMAILTAASSAIKDSQTQKNVHIIKTQLQHLHIEFLRFNERMEKLSKHISLAHEDVQKVAISAQKITARFKDIEKAEVIIEETLDSEQLVS